ncbi:hypothetical protein PaG_03636 [Moesziomyces aphidis]|uniref:RRM domain-containing protein n=1 Tax=Moesziomyces aphidis TaxID=84754 RepID=W3VK88_MOEAP|nr:hypothetical protein PaG_03636 [Moesziomyces aphidis]
MMARGQTESPDKPCTSSVRWSDERMRDKRTTVPATPWRPRILRRDLSIDIDQPSPLDRKVTLPPLKLMRDDPVFSPAPSSATLVPSAEKHDEPKGDAYRCTHNSPFLPRAPPNTTSKPDHALRSAKLQETDAQALLRQGGGMNKAGETNVYVNGLPKEINDNTLYLLGSFCGVVISHKAMLDRHTGLCKGFGFLMYATPDMATTAIEWLNSHGFSASFAKESFSARLRRMTDTSSTNVYLSNLPVKLNEAQLEQLFNPHPVASLKILYDVHGESKGVGFVRLLDRQTARTCIERLHGRVLPGTTLPLQVRFADSEGQKHLKHSVQQKHTLESLGLLNHKATPSPAVHTRAMQSSEVRSGHFGGEMRPSGLVASRACVGMPSVPVSPELPISSNLYGPGGLGIQVPPMWAPAHPMVNAMQLAQPVLAEWTSMPTAPVVFPEPLFYATDQYRVPVVDWAQKKSEPEPLAALPRPFIPPPGLVPRDGEDSPSQPAHRQHARKEARLDGAARVRIAGGEVRSINDGARAVSDPTTLLAAQARARDTAGAGRVRRAMSVEHNHTVHDDETASSEHADDDDSSLSIEIQIHADA